MKKIFTLSALAVATLAAGAQSVQSIQGSEENPYSYDGLSISANHRYVCGTINMNYGGFIWDTETGAIAYHEDGTDGGCELRGVTNDGVAYGFGGYEPSYALRFAMDGQWAELPMPGGSEALANGCNPDGTVVAGLVYGSDYTSHACLWKNGALVMLPEPTSEEAGYEVNGTRAEGVSADGKIVVGSIVDNFSTMPAVMWRLNEQTGQYVFDNFTKDIYIGDEWEAPEGTVKAMQISPSGISANGQWVSLTVIMSDNEAGNMEFGRYNTVTKQLEVKGFGESNNIFSSDISDEGAVVGFTYFAPWGGAQGVREPLLWAAGSGSEVVSISSTYCTDFFEPYVLCNNSACSITPDGRYVQGYLMDEDGNDITYVVDLDGTTGVKSVVVNPADAPMEVYNLNGVRVASSLDALAPGVYVVRQGDKTFKQVIR